MANTRVKVPRLTLIERIQERIDEATAKHEADIAKYEKEIVDYLAMLPAALDAESKRISAMKADEAREFFERLRDSRYSDGKSVVLSVKMPEKFPEKPDESDFYYTDSRDRYRYRGFNGYVKSLEKAKKVLEASTEELISVSATDFYADYL